MIKKSVLLLLCSFLSIIMLNSLFKIKVLANNPSKIILLGEYSNMDTEKTYQIPDIYNPVTGIVNPAAKKPHAIVVGTAITRPQTITKRFVDAL